jgi:ketosteroid isomerase-like protein
MTSSWKVVVRHVVVVMLIGRGEAIPLWAQGPATPAPEDTIRALESRRAEALLKADVQALSNLVADDFVEISRLGQLRTKADNVRDIASGDLKLSAVRYEDLTVRVYGDVAVLTGIADNVGTARGIPFSGKVRYTRVFVRRDGRWQAVLMQQTSMLDTPPNR